MFNKEKELILKILNAVLIIWLIIALVVGINSVVNFVIKKPALTYEEYQIVNCEENKDDEKLTNCQRQYQSENIIKKEQNYNNWRQLIMAGANIIIVTTAILILNKKKSKK